MARKTLRPLNCSPMYALSLLLWWSVATPAAEVVAPAVDGMLIDTKDNVLQQVRIRVKSFGPGFCAVRIIFAGKIHSISAPPLTWSSWTAIGPAVNGGAYDLDFTPECDTGALGEVKYDK
jgi:hypothetical protein